MAKTTEASRREVTHRLEQLEREWDIDRFLEMNSTTVALGGVMLALLTSKKFLFIPLMVLSYKLRHSLQGGYPPMRALRLLGFRTRDEIEREKAALKAIRGDFENLQIE